MARSIVLISCVSKKQSQAAKAKDLYVSPLFYAQRDYAERFGSEWYILSAKHHLLHPDTIVEPYEKTLKGAGVAAQREWSALVFAELAKVTTAEDEIFITAGEDYCRHLTPLLTNRGNLVVKPLKGFRLLSRAPQLRQLVTEGRKV